jgi:hypothetical protein
VTVTVKLRCFAGTPFGVTTAVTIAIPTLAGLSITVDAPSLFDLSSTLADPIGIETGVNLVEEVDDVTAGAVVVVDEFVVLGVTIVSPPLDVLQCTGTLGKGVPSIIALIEIIEVWFVKMLAGPPEIVSPAGIGRNTSGRVATPRPGVEKVSVADPGTAGAIGIAAKSPPTSMKAENTFGNMVLFDDVIVMLTGVLALAGVPVAS